MSMYQKGLVHALNAIVKPAANWWRRMQLGGHVEYFVLLIGVFLQYMKNC